MEQVEMERNARRLYSILAYTPKERKEERDEYVDNPKMQNLQRTGITRLPQIC